MDDEPKSNSENLRTNEWTLLHGGNVNTVFCKGNVVRRQTSPASHAIHQVLQWLYAHDLQQVPRLLRVTEDNEFLTFLPGKPVLRPWSDEVKGERWMTELGDWLRRYHQAITGFELKDEAAFLWGPATPEIGMIVCHGDLGPWNCIQKDGVLTGVIDWDLARYGYPLDDIAELALEAVPLRPLNAGNMDTDTTKPVLWKRLSALCNAYGSVDPSEILHHVPKYIDTISRDIKARAKRGIEPFVSFVEGGIVAELEQDKVYVTTEWLS